jgi:hypothetical protein
MRARIFAACALGCLTFMSLLMSPRALLGSETKSHSVTIKGVITNLAEAKQLITSDTYLQLAPLGPGGTFSVTYDGRGRVSIGSNLPKTSMPAQGSTGAFSFDCKGLDEGTYVVAVQLSAVNHSVVLKKDRRPLLIRVSKNTGPTLDVGEVTIPVQ